MQSSQIEIISGVVERGRQLGRTLGFPTANVALPVSNTARFGVYATRTRLDDGREFAGVASLGVNPTVGRVKPVLEVWLFDFDGDLYGRRIETELVSYLREERVFSGLGALVAQIRRDADDARRLRCMWHRLGGPGRYGSSKVRKPKPGTP